MEGQHHEGDHHFAHHFQSGVHEFETCKQGMWLFLLQEVLFFTPFFVAFFLFRAMYHADFHFCSHELDWRMGAINTVFLISSSYTMARAVSASQRGEKDKTVQFLFFTLIFAMGFLVIKYFEYAHKFEHGTLPGMFFKNEEILKEAPHAPLFFSLYFGMTCLHALHVIVGMGVIGWVLLRAKRGEFGPKYFTPVEMTGLYWHFVDLVWIYLFPLLYLVG